MNEFKLYGSLIAYDTNGEVSEPVIIKRSKSLVLDNAITLFNSDGYEDLDNRICIDASIQDFINEDFPMMTTVAWEGWTLKDTVQVVKDLINNKYYLVENLRVFRGWMTRLIASWYREFDDINKLTNGMSIYVNLEVREALLRALDEGTGSIDDYIPHSVKNLSWEIGKKYRDVFYCI